MIENLDVRQDCERVTRFEGSVAWL